MPESRSELTLGDAGFAPLAASIHDLCGLAHDAGQGLPVKRRLDPLVHAWDCSTFATFYQSTQGRQLALRDRGRAAITTNETSFFRDVHPAVRCDWGPARTR